MIEDREDYHKKLNAAQLVERQRVPVDFHVLINPRIVARDATNVEFFEGCLSVNGLAAMVPRARAVTVEYLNERGEAKSVEAVGWYARILQHEIDHTNGVLFIDHLSKLKRDRVIKKFTKAAKNEAKGSSKNEASKKEEA